VAHVFLAAFMLSNTCYCWAWHWDFDSVSLISLCSCNSLFSPTTQCVSDLCTTRYQLHLSCTWAFNVL